MGFYLQIHCMPPAMGKRTCTSGMGMSDGKRVRRQIDTRERMFDLKWKLIKVHCSSPRALATLQQRVACDRKALTNRARPS